jgi:hypothetical protein
MHPATHSAAMQSISSISPAIPARFPCQFMGAWTEAGQAPRLTRIHAPHSIWPILAMILSSQFSHGMNEEMHYQRWTELSPETKLNNACYGQGSWLKEFQSIIILKWDS